MLLSRHGYGRKAETCTLLAAAGWQAMDINDTCDHQLFYQPTAEAMAYVQEALDTVHRAGLQVGQCHAPMPPCYATLTPGELEQRIQSIENCVDIAGRLGIPYVVVHPLVHDWNAPDPSTDHAFQMNVDYLRRICHRAENTIVCLENMPGKYGFIRTGEDMARMLEAVGDDRLMVCLDTGHLFCQQEKPTNFFVQVGDRIRVTHIHDSVGSYDAHLLAGTGQGDWADFVAAIRNYGYKGNLNSESNFFSRTPAHLRLQGQVLERQMIGKMMP